MIDNLKDNCCGCGVCGDICSHHAITFVPDSEGFLFPHIDSLLCSKCNLCERICPILSPPQVNSVLKSVAAYTDKKTPHSSSGGIFATLASTILSNAGVVYGAAFDVNMHLRHTRITNISDLPKLCGSKYVQSDCAGVYKQVKEDLRQNLPVLFSGTPCQVAGLKNYLCRDYDNLYLIDLICHGVPSPGIFSDYLHFCEKLRKRKVKYFLCRDNRDGWNNKFKSTLTFTNGKEEYNSMLANLWNRIFFSELVVRKNCEHCHFANQSRIGDLTLGDFWGIENSNSLLYNKDGVSLILVNTHRGNQLLQGLQHNVIMAPAYTCEKEHPNLYHSIKQNTLRSQFMVDYSAHGFAFIANKYFTYNRILDFKVRLSNFLK